MTAILSMLAVLATALLYYRAAQSRSLPGIAWAVAGVIIYYGGFLAWMHLILRPIMGGGFQAHGFWSGIGMDLTSIVAGATAAGLFGYFRLIRKPSGTP